MRVLITGGAGYLGAVVSLTLLGKGHEVRVLDCLRHGGEPLLGVWSHRRFSFHRADLRDADAVRSALEGQDAVVHLAALVGDPACAKNPQEARSVNIEASLGLIRESARSGVRRFVFASTCSNYGRMRDPSQYVDEQSELRPVSLYAETKVEVEKALLEQEISEKMAATVLRFATLFGTSPRMRFDLTVNEFTMELLLKKSLEVYGEQFWRPYVHVRDAAEAIARVLESEKESLIRKAVYNVGSTKNNFRKQDLIEIIQRVIPGGEVKCVRREEDPRDYRVSFEKIRTSLNFSPVHDVEDGVREIAALLSHGLIRDPFSPVHRNTA